MLVEAHTQRFPGFKCTHITFVFFHKGKLKELSLNVRYCVCLRYRNQYHVQLARTQKLVDNEPLAKLTEPSPAEPTEPEPRSF